MAGHRNGVPWPRAVVCEHFRAMIYLLLVLALAGCASHSVMTCRGKGKITGGGGPYAGVIEWDCGPGSRFSIDKSIMQLNMGETEVGSPPTAH